MLQLILFYLEVITFIEGKNIKFWEVSGTAFRVLEIFPCESTIFLKSYVTFKGGNNIHQSVANYFLYLRYNYLRTYFSLTFDAKTFGSTFF